MLGDNYIYNSGIKIYKRPTMSKRYSPRPPMSPFEEDSTKEWREEFDNCLLCGEKTVYKTTDNIHSRTEYIEGAGQLCVSCDRKHSEGGVSRFA